jgi:hypothetical protein
MFSFLNPILLWALLALALPLLIHFFSRRRIKKIDFSSLVFLRSLEKTRLRAVRIKELLLLLIRSLIILCVVLAFARPSSRGGFTSKLGAEAKSSILFLMDNSYRMGYETKTGNLLRIAQRKAEELLKNYKIGDELYLVIYNSEPEAFLSHPIFDSSLISRAIGEMELTFEPADLDKALERGLNLLSPTVNENKEIYLFTDLKPGEISVLTKWSSRFKDKGVKLFIIRLSKEEKENWAIENIELPQKIITKDVPFEVQGTVKNFSQRPVQNLLLSLYLDGKRVSQTDVDLIEGQEGKVSFTQSVSETGFHWGYLELSDDNLLVDNKRYFSFGVPQQIEVLLVQSKEKKQNYLKLALNPEGEGKGRIKITQVEPGFFHTKELSDYDVIIFSDYEGVKLEDLLSLEGFLNSGKGIFFFFGETKEELYGEICQKYLGSTFKGKEGSSGRAEGFLTLEQVDLFHPLFLPYKGLDKSRFPLIKFYSIYQIIPGRSTRILASFSNGSPALVENLHGRGKIIALLSSMEPEFSDLGEHTFLVPLMQRAVEYLSSGLFSSKEFLVGEKARKEFGFKKAERIELLNPENLKIILLPEIIEGKVILKLNDLGMPGIYKLQSADEILDQFAVNLDTRDSDAGELKDEDLKKGLKGNENILIMKPDQDLKEEVLKTRYGKELSRNFLWLALGLLILEMLISKSRKRDLEYFSESSGEESAQKI